MPCGIDDKAVTSMELELGHKVDINEVKEIDSLNTSGKIKTTSSVYSIESLARLDQGEEKWRIQCFYEPAKNKIYYWREKNY